MIKNNCEECSKIDQIRLQLEKNIRETNLRETKIKEKKQNVFIISTIIKT